MSTWTEDDKQIAARALKTLDRRASHRAVLQFIALSRCGAKWRVSALTIFQNARMLGWQCAAFARRW
jgi:hypothetical protein